MSQPFSMSLMGSRVISAVAIFCVVTYLAGCTGQALKPQTTEPLVDYVALANERLKPADYDPNLNATPLYEQLLTTFEPLPEAMLYEPDVWPGDHNVTALEQLAQWSVRTQPAVGLFQAACRKPYWWTPYTSQDGTLHNAEMPLLAERRQWIFGVEVLSYYRAYQGDLAAALDMLMDGHATAAQHYGHRNLVEQVVGMAIAQRCNKAGLRLLGRFDGTPALLRRIQHRHKEVYAAVRPSPFVPCEKFVLLDWLQRSFRVDRQGRQVLMPERLCQASDVVLNPEPALTLRQAKRICRTHPDREATFALADALYETMADLLDQSPYELHEKGGSYLDEMYKVTGPGNVMSYGLPCTAQVFQIIQQYVAAQGAFSTCLGVLRFRAEKGTLPESLGQLVGAGYLSELALDPYSDKPFVYRVTDGGFLLYSVGSDFTDNGGERDDWNEPGADRVFWPTEFSSPVDYEDDMSLDAYMFSDDM